MLVTGGTGYLGRALIRALIGRGHAVRALVRPGSGLKLPTGTVPLVGDALKASDVKRALVGADTVVHLVGVPKPSPAKARQFREVDLASIQAMADAITETEAQPHLVYLSVAQPAPVMRAYVEVRAAGEALVRERGIRATFMRPWYVLGPGHRWPYLLVPVYAVLRRLPGTRESAERLGLVTLEQMIRAMVNAVEHPPLESVRIVDVPAIRAARVDVDL